MVPVKMVCSRRTLGVWLLAMHFVAVTVVGEAWHLLPGSDHLGRAVSRRVSGDAVCLDVVGHGGSPSAGPAATWPDSSDLTADGCPICQFLGKAKASQLVIPQPAVRPLVVYLPSPGVSLVTAVVIRSHLIRGPPAR
jgi:hypothetical protein